MRCIVAHLGAGAEFAVICGDHTPTKWSDPVAAELELLDCCSRHIVVR